MNFKVNILYCGAWGYDKKFNKFAIDLKAKFGERLLELTSEMTKGWSGLFEVTVIKNEKESTLIHSKKETGKLPEDFELFC